MANETKKSALDILRISAILFLICAIVAGVVSLVFAATDSSYQENLKRVRNDAMSELFGGEVECVPFMTGTLLAEFSEVEEVYSVRPAGEEQTCYCVSLVVGGFGGDMNLMVAFNADDSVRGVRVVSHSETPGLGSRVADSAYLAAYAGRGGELSLGEDVDAIAGSTISSRAVLDGVNTACRAMAAFRNGGEN